MKLEAADLPEFPYQCWISPCGYQVWRDRKSGVWRWRLAGAPPSGVIQGFRGLASTGSCEGHVQAAVACDRHFVTYHLLLLADLLPAGAARDLALTLAWRARTEMGPALALLDLLEENGLDGRAADLIRLARDCGVPVPKALEDRFPCVLDGRTT
jgi:hypothetical protein